MRTAWLFSGFVLGLLVFHSPAVAQTAVEYGAGAGAAATATAAGAKAVGASIGGAFDSVNKALKQAQGEAPKVQPAAKARPAAPGPAAAKPKTEVVKDPETPATAPAAKPSYEDAIGIQKGMACEEVARRFGPPAMAFATEDDAQTMSYASKAGGVQVECQSGKVASVEKPGS